MKKKLEPSKSSLKVVFFGDSICFGQHVSPHLGWVTRIGVRLEAILAQKDPTCLLRLSNSSISGNTTRMALERMPFDVQAAGVDVGYVQFGMNDANVWQTDGGLPRVSPAGFSANLHEILDRMKRFGARKLMLGTNHPTTRDAHNMPGVAFTYEHSNRTYNDLIRAVARARDDVVLVDHAAAWHAALAGGADLPTLLLDDGLHLSLGGHDLYFETAAPVLCRVTSELGSE